MVNKIQGIDYETALPTCVRPHWSCAAIYLKKRITEPISP